MNPLRRLDAVLSDELLAAQIETTCRTAEATPAETTASIGDTSNVIDQTAPGSPTPAEP